MKTMRSPLTFAAAVLLTASMLRGQTATVRAVSNKTPDSAAVSQDAKEKAEDAALLDQLDSSAPAAGGSSKHSQKKWNPGADMAGESRGGNGGGGVSYRLQNIMTRQGGVVKPLIVRTSEPDAKAQAALGEDLSIMGRLLDKAVEDLPGGQRHTIKAMGIDVLAWSGSTPMRCLYLDNYGAVFFLNVSFPLVAPPEKREDEKAVGDSAWEDARQELFGQRLGTTSEPGEDYSQEKVDKLKATLLETLRNATNIKGLKPEEFVTIWVSGGTSSGNKKLRALKNNPPGTLGGNLEQPIPAARQTILTIRATKADIDAFAKGKLASDEFQKHAKVITYTGDPGSPAPDAPAIVYSGRTGF
jgi:hypothetical protein